MSTINSCGRHIGSHLCPNLKKIAKMKDHRSVVLVLLLCLVAESKSMKHELVCADPNKQLLNNVIYEGRPSSFSNQPDPVGVKWEYVPSDSDQSKPIANNGAVQPSIAAYYTVDATHLSISVVKTGLIAEPPITTSGLYSVTYNSDGCQSMANLVAVTGPPFCRCATTDSENAVLMCDIGYGVNSQYPNEPKIIWTTDSGKTVYGKEETRPNHKSTHDLRSSISIKSSDVAKYTCGVTFTAPKPSGPANMATNAPPFQASCKAAVCEADV